MQTCIYEKCFPLFGEEITITATQLDAGLHVLLSGGHQSHIGAVSICCPGEAVRTTVLPGHKDDHISARWAQTLCELSGLTCCVVCGIHYDNASAFQIREILNHTDLQLHFLTVFLQSSAEAAADNC